MDKILEWKILQKWKWRFYKNKNWGQSCLELPCFEERWENEEDKVKNQDEVC